VVWKVHSGILGGIPSLFIQLRQRKFYISSNLLIGIIVYRPGHEGSIKNGAMDPMGEFMATIGCDG